MDRKKAAMDIMELFIRVTNRYNFLEKIPARHEAKHDLYHSERHMLDMIAGRPDLNITEHAANLGVTKGAISQTVKKLASKGLVTRYRKGGNDKAVYIELTMQGRNFVEKRREVNDRTLQPLYEELRRHSDDKVEFLIDMFRWIDGYLERSRKEMEEHRR